MSIYSFNSRNGIRNTGILFYGKKAYREELLKRNAKNYIDLWHVKPLYGKVDKDFNVVHVSSDHLKLVNDGLAKEDVYALNFVADAFNALGLYMKELSQKKKIRESFYYPLKAYKGWRPVNIEYKKHLDSLYQIFVDDYILGNDKRINYEITSFQTFLPIFVDYLNTAMNSDLSFTKSGFITRVNFPHASSGLIIEIADENSASADMNKYINYFSSREDFELYSGLAQKFGFYVDINMPWRLVANLESPAWSQNPILKKIVDSYFPGGYNIRKVFNKYYHRAYESDVVSLRNLIVQFYNSFVSDESSPTVPRVCHDLKGFRYATSADEIFKKVVTRDFFTELERKENYDYSFWLKMYIQVRLKEMQVDISENQVLQELRQAEQVWASTGVNAALEHVAERTAAMLEQEVGNYISLFAQGKPLLTTGKTPDIIL